MLCFGRQSGSDELGLNDHHQSQLSRYLRFARLQRDKRLRTIDAAFEDCMLSRYGAGWQRRSLMLFGYIYRYIS